MADEYWIECISLALDEVGIDYTSEQCNVIAEFVEGSYENYSMYCGYDVASSNYISDTERELKELKLEKKRHEDYLNSTAPCPQCNTTGLVYDGWGRSVTCDKCSGKGRI